MAHVDDRSVTCRIALPADLLSSASAAAQVAISRILLPSCLDDKQGAAWAAAARLADALSGVLVLAPSQHNFAAACRAGLAAYEADVKAELALLTEVITASDAARAARDAQVAAAAAAKTAAARKRAVADEATRFNARRPIALLGEDGLQAVVRHLRRKEACVLMTASTFLRGGVARCLPDTIWPGVVNGMVVERASGNFDQIALHADGWAGIKAAVSRATMDGCVLIEPGVYDVPMSPNAHLAIARPVSIFGRGAVTLKAVPGPELVALQAQLVAAQAVAAQAPFAREPGAAAAAAATAVRAMATSLCMISCGEAIGVTIDGLKLVGVQEITCIHLIGGVRPGSLRLQSITIEADGRGSGLRCVTTGLSTAPAPVPAQGAGGYQGFGLMAAARVPVPVPVVAPVLAPVRLEVVSCRFHALCRGILLQGLVNGFVRDCDFTDIADTAAAVDLNTPGKFWVHANRFGKNVAAAVISRKGSKARVSRDNTSECAKQHIRVHENGTFVERFAASDQDIDLSYLED